MSLRELCGYQPVGFRHMDAAKEILEANRGHNVLFALTAAINYGVILGKRAERAKRKAARKEGTP